MLSKKKLFLITTIPISLRFFKGQIGHLKSDFDIVLISSKGDHLESLASEEQVAYRQVEMKRDISLINDIKSLITLLLLFCKEQPHIVHCNTPKGSFLGLLAGCLARIPIRIYYVHGLRYQGEENWKRKLLMAMEKISCFCATNIISVSYGVKATLNKEISSKKIDVIGHGSPNGIDLKKYNPRDFNEKLIREQLKIDPGDFVFGFVGRLVGDKGINELVSSFSILSKRNPNIKLVLVGNFEEDLDPLQKGTLTEIENNEQILYFGFQPDVLPFLRIMNVFVFPSYREGFGMSLMEANAMNVPAITTNITGCNEIVEDGVNGFIIESKNRQHLYERMEYCLANKGQIKEMACACRNIIAQKYEQRMVWEDALNRYRSLI